jgi:CubicO group peptidase (beta-lactamase class C family)
MRPSAQPSVADVERLVSEFFKRRRIPGGAVAVVRAGKVAYAAGHGRANVELDVPATAETLFEIGSISKQVTAEAVMQLVQAGRLSLDAPIAQYVTELPPTWQGMTVRHLVTHTRGLPDWETQTEFSYRREYTLDEFVQLLAPLPLLFAPGAQFGYTNSGFPLLGRIVEAVGGRPFEEYVHERIFAPAGMRDTRFRRPPEVVLRRAAGYVERDGRLENGEPLRPRIIAANGGILSSARDMAQWLVALTSGVVLSPSALQQMTEPIRLNDGRPVGAGVAWFLDAFRGHRVLVHNGSTVAGFSSVVYHYPDDGLSVVVLMNIDRWNAVNVLATQVGDLFVSGLATCRLPERPDPDPQVSGRFRRLLADVAQSRDSELLAPALRNPPGAPRVSPSFGFEGSGGRFVFLEREERDRAIRERYGQIAITIYRYRLHADGREICYTFEMDSEGKVARFFPEES